MKKSNWRKSNRRQELPPNWQELRRECARRAGGRCEHVSADGVRCTQMGTDADHALDRNNHAVLQWLCPEHHKRKTALESRAGSVSRRRRGERRRRDDRPGAL